MARNCRLFYDERFQINAATCGQFTATEHCSRRILCIRRKKNLNKSHS